MQTIHEAAERVRSGATSPVQLLEECLARIDRYEDKVRAWVMLDRDGALATAREREREAKAGQWRGPLHGIPIGIKDIFDIYDWPTTGGSKRWATSYARHDAPVVERLRRAGAVFVGKTVTTAFASFDPPVTRNPWDRTRTPGGSTSGSAAALGCGMCLGALGSQTGGSITRPASYCGVAGCKPTYGRVSCTGVMPLAASMDHPGPMARSVRDLALMLQVMADPEHGFAPGGAGQPARIGRPRGLFAERADAAVSAMMDEVCAALRKQGATIVDAALPAGFSEVIARHRVVMAVEALAYHAERLQRHPEDYPPNFRSLLAEGEACPAVEYARCKEFQRQLTAETSQALAGVDAWICPATTSPAPDATTTGDPAFNSPWSFTGLPVVSFPVKKTANGLPLAVQLAGDHWSEAALFAAAEWCEAQAGIDVGLPE